MTLDEAEQKIKDVKSRASNVVGAMNDCEKGHTNQIEEALTEVSAMDSDLKALDEFFASR